MSREKETFILRDAINAENLPGYKKKSFSLAYHGGEIWFEHLDGIYDHENLALKKLAEDTAMFARPSSPCDICFVFDETTVTDRMIGAVKKAILGSGKRFMKIAFAGLAPKASTNAYISSFLILFSTLIFTPPKSIFNSLTMWSI